MPAPMKDRQYQNFSFTNGVIDAVELEAMYWRAAHVGKADSMKQR
jgi:hypothetical protein